MTTATCPAAALSTRIACSTYAKCGQTPNGRRQCPAASISVAKGLGFAGRCSLGRLRTGLGLTRKHQVASSERRGSPRIVSLAGDGEAGSPSATLSDKTSLLAQLKEAIAQKDSEKAKAALEGLKEGGNAKLWNCYSNVSRRTTFMRELTQIGIKNAETLAIPSVRNDALFLASVVGVTSVLAVIAGQLPGDWGFFVPYLIGSITLVVLAIGSTAPGLLEAGLQFVSRGFPDTKERVLRHEAAHFLVAYLVGLPVVAYSLDLGKEHTNLVDEKLQRRIYEGKLDGKELDKLAAVSMAGLAAEGLNYDKVVGQSADLFTLQRLINRSKPPLSNDQQQNLTRWAVVFAASLIKSNSKAYDALKGAMEAGASVEDCIAAIEAA